MRDNPVAHYSFMRFDVISVTGLLQSYIVMTTSINKTI